MSQTSQQQIERRSGTDRRLSECEYSFPYIDGHGFLVTAERRKLADRRQDPELRSHAAM